MSCATPKKSYPTTEISPEASNAFSTPKLQQAKKSRKDESRRSRKDRSQSIFRSFAKKSQFALSRANSQIGSTSFVTTADSCFGSNEVYSPRRELSQSVSCVAQSSAKCDGSIIRDLFVRRSFDLKKHCKLAGIYTPLIARSASHRDSGTSRTVVSTGWESDSENDSAFDLSARYPATTAFERCQRRVKNKTKAANRSCKSASCFWFFCRLYVVLVTTFRT